MSVSTCPSRQYERGKISEPGVYANVPIDVYHGDPCVRPSISSSGLRTIWNQSPAHYWAYSVYNPEKFEKPGSEALDIGKAAHHWLLGESDFSKHFIIAPYDDFRTKEAREWKAAQIAAGRTVLKQEQMEAIVGMRDGLLRHPLISGGILDGEVERSLFCQHQPTGLWLRARPDVIPHNDGTFVDLKTTTSIARSDIARSIADYGYAMQAALLRKVCANLGIPFSAFAFVFVEKTPPFCARVVVLKDHEIDRGERQVDAAIAMFAEGLETGIWPGPDGDSDDAEFIETPSWAQSRADEKLAYFKALRESAL